MNERDKDKPIGWILPAPPPTTAEVSAVKEQALAWTERNQQVLKDLHLAIAADLEGRDGDALLMWRAVLGGLAGEIASLLTHQEVEVVQDATVQ